MLLEICFCAKGNGTKALPIQKHHWQTDNSVFWRRKELPDLSIYWKQRCIFRERTKVSESTDFGFQMRTFFLLISENSWKQVKHHPLSYLIAVAIFYKVRILCQARFFQQSASELFLSTWKIFLVRRWPRACKQVGDSFFSTKFSSPNPVLLRSICHRNLLEHMFCEQTQKFPVFTIFVSKRRRNAKFLRHLRCGCNWWNFLPIAAPVKSRHTLNEHIETHFTFLILMLLLSHFHIIIILVFVVWRQQCLVAPVQMLRWFTKLKKFRCFLCWRCRRKLLKLSLLWSPWLFANFQFSLGKTVSAVRISMVILVWHNAARLLVILWENKAQCSSFPLFPEREYMLSCRAERKS